MLHNLHHQLGQNLAGKMFAYCPHCTKCWTNEEFVKSYLVNAVGVPGLTGYPDNRVRRLKAMVVNYQSDAVDDVNTVIINAAYNHHIHMKSCFKSTKDTAEFVQKNGTNAKRKKILHTVMNADIIIHIARNKELLFRMQLLVL